VVAGFTLKNRAVRFALENIPKIQLRDGSCSNKYELRVVPTLIKLRVINQKQALEIIRTIEN